MSRRPAPSLEPIAIVGIGCRFPGAEGPAALWQLVVNGVDAITDMPSGRFDAEALYDPTPGARGKIATRQGGFLGQIDGFEPSFFGISPREAACIDPQQRLLLEVAWEAFEDAGVTQERLVGSETGVFIGMWTSEYEGLMFGASSDVDLYVTTGGGRYAASGRVSYAFDLRGPSLTLDTACSSSLVAVHLACQSLRSGESEMALAGGVNLILEPHITIGYSRSAMLSADGRCRFGDARASGYVRSEGVGLVLLKPLSRALADRDPIHALIRGSAVNNDGQGSGLLVAPSQTVQAAMLRQAYRAAGVEPARVGYVEAHGTGTRVGDPVELAALGDVLGEGRAAGRRCLTGSVKTNIGHTEAASGIAGLIKAVLCLEHRTIPPSLHFSEPNPRIPWDELPLVITRTAQPWPDEPGPAFAGVNSFGVTGTNAHVVLEEAPASSLPRATAAAAGRVRALPLSAKSPEALRALAQRWVALLEHEAAAEQLDDRLYTASVRRSHHEHRLAVVGTNELDLAQSLRAYANGEAQAGLVSGRTAAARPRVVFVFPGMGSQLLGMGRALLATEPVFREALERCERALAPHVDWSLLEELAAEGERSQLDRVDVMQPALFAVEVALSALWRSWGIEPDAVVGHSMGEVAAAHVAGTLSLPDAARVIALRSRLLGKIAGLGGMAMVELSLDDARRALLGRDDKLCVAASNSARSSVVSGEAGALAELLADLERRGVFCRRLKVDVAFHSPQVDALRADLQAGLEGIAPRASDVAFYSTVTGTLVAGERLGPEYWARNLREPVLFAAALGRLAADAFDVFVETSLHPVLVPAVQEAMPSSGQGICLTSGRRGEDERAVMLESLASLWAGGYPVDWARRFPDGGRVVSLPGYPWQRERFWFEANRTRPVRSTEGHPLLTTHVTLATAGGELWEGQIAAADHACLASDPHATLSSRARLHAVLSAATQVVPGTLTLEDVRFPDELRFANDVARVQLVVRPHATGHEVQLFGRPSLEAAWTTIASVGCLSGSSLDGAERARHDLDTIQARSDELDLDGLEGWPRHDHRPSLAALRVGDGEALGRLHETPAAECVLHPEALEAGLRVLVTALGASDEGAGGWELSAIRTVRVHAPLAHAAWVFAVAADAVARRVGDLCFLDATGTAVAELHGVEISRPSGAVEDLFHRVEWQPQPRVSGASRSPGRWLVVADPTAYATELVARLQAAGDTCVVVSAAQALDGAVAEILASPSPVTGCVHLASIGVNPDASPTVPDAADLGWASALAVVHALAAGAASPPPRLWLVTRGAQRVIPSDASLSLGAGAVWGLGASIPYEHPALRATRVDLGLDGFDAPVLAEELLGADAEDQVALRGATRYAARLVRGAPTGVGSSVAGGSVPVTADGAYLITGGTGGLGLVVARWLVSRGARHLTLMGRRPPTADVARVVDELRAAGAEVSIARGDVTRRADVGRVVAELSGGRRLRGVIHAAGFVDDGLLVNLDRERFASVLATKADGAINLDEATRELALDFFVCFSSAIGVLGSPGQANYAAANACVDAVAARRRAQGQAALSIAWGPWARVGMAAARRDRGQRLAARGLASLAPEEGIEALGRLLATSATQVLVMRLDPDRWSQAYAAGARSLLRDSHEAPSAAPESSGMLARLRAAAPGERRSLLETDLREQVGQVLRVAAARVDPATPLKSLGLNSLMSLELRNRLEAAFGLTLPATLAWNYPTVTALAAHLEERLGLATPVVAVPESVPAAEPELESLLAEIQGLSDDEVRRLLAEGRTGATNE